MRISMLLLISALGLGVLLIVLGATSFHGENVVPNDNSYKTYNGLVRSSTILYPVLSSEEEFSRTIDDIKQLRQNQRNDNMAALQKFMENIEETELLANALSYVALNHYANAFDHKSVESAQEAVAAFRSAIVLAPGSAEEGYSEIEWERRRFLESAQNLLADAIENEQKEQGQQQDKQADPASVPARESVGQEGPDSQDELPILVPGTKK